MAGLDINTKQTFVKRPSVLISEIRDTYSLWCCHVQTKSPEDHVDFKLGPIWNYRCVHPRSCSGSLRCQLFGCLICCKTSTSSLIATRSWCEQFYQSLACIYPIWSECSVNLIALWRPHKNSIEQSWGEGRGAWKNKIEHLAASLSTDVALNTLHAPLHISTNGQLRADVIFFSCPALSTHFTLKINWIYNPLSGGRLLSASFSSCCDVWSPHLCSVDHAELWLLIVI